MTAFFRKRKITNKEYADIIETLTPSEYRLYEVMIKGYRASEAAKCLSLKKTTVDSYLKTIYRKLDVRSIVEMIITYGPAYNAINNYEQEQ